MTGDSRDPGRPWTGKRVRCTGAGGFTFETTAHSEPHLNEGQTLGRAKPWMVVSIEVPGEPERKINWPVKDVELLASRSTCERRTCDSR